MNTHEIAREILAQNAQVLANNERLFALIQPDVAATVTAPVTAPVTETPAEPAPVATKPLSRGAWKRLRVTRKGDVRAAFRGLTREQAFEAGLCPGFHLPTGDRKAAIVEWKAAQEG